MASQPSKEVWKRIYQFNLKVAYPRMSEEKKQRILAKAKQKQLVK